MEKRVLAMEYTKLKTLEGLNLFGKKNIIYLTVEAKYKYELEILLNEYNSFTERFNISSDLTVLDNKLGYIEVCIKCSRVEISKYILDNLFKLECKEKINKEALKIIKYDWSYYIQKKCDDEKIPFIKVNDDEVQLGYGVNSVRINKDNHDTSKINEIIYSLKENSNGLIPIISVTGTNGKTTTVRLIHNILLKLGYKSGLSSTGGIYIGEKLIKHGDTTGFYSAREVLKKQNINVAVLETARGGILKKGLGYQSAKVAIITSISEDHIGLEGVKTIDDLANIKSIIADELVDDGIIIIKAIEVLVNRFKHRKNVVLFEYNKNTYIDEHIKHGGSAYYVQNDTIVFESLEGRRNIISVKEIPFAFNGVSKSNIKNVIVAIAAVSTIHKNINDIINILKEFQCNIYTNLGRQNIIDFNSFKLMIDYGHNSESFNEVFSIAKELKPSRITGLITAAGDRGAAYIEELGAITAKFCDKIIVKEQPDLRGREIGETARLLKDGAVKAGFNEVDIRIILSEEDAIKISLEEAIEGEIIVSFSQFLYLTMPVINKFRVENGMEAIGEDLDLSH